MGGKGRDAASDDRRILYARIQSGAWNLLDRHYHTRRMARESVTKAEIIEEAIREYVARYADTEKGVG